MQDTPATPRPASTGLDDAMAAFMLDREAMRCTAKTLDHYHYTIGSFVSWLKTQDVATVTSITPMAVRHYLVSLQQRGLKDTSQHTHARGIRAWLNWLVNEGLVRVSPMARVSMPRLEARIPPPFSPEDVRALLSGCDRNTPQGARNYAILLTLLDTGLRASELVSLRVGDLDMQTGLATVLGKGRKQRRVRMGARARTAILRMLSFRDSQQPDASLWLAYSPSGQASGVLGLRGLQIMLRRLGRRVGVEPCGPHRFRRTFALWCLRDGMDLHSLRLLMGHTTLAVLQRYLALAGEDIERAHAAHSPADKLLKGGDDL